MNMFHIEGENQLNTNSMLTIINDNVKNFSMKFIIVTILFTKVICNDSRSVFNDEIFTRFKNQYDLI